MGNVVVTGKNLNNKVEEVLVEGGALSIGDRPFAVVVTISGSYTYIAEAVPGTATSSALWRAQRVDGDGNTVWADGDANFDNVATDLTALSYS